jgi:hypothetical protein
MSACSWEEVAPDRFRMGVTRGDAGAIELGVLDCLGGDLRKLIVFDSKGSPTDPRSVVWRLAEGVRRYSLQPRKVSTIEFGRAPLDMMEVVALREETLSQAESLSVNVDTSRQGYGFVFDPADARKGTYWSRDERLSVDEFREAGWCPHDA